MSSPGRPKGEFRRAQPEGTPATKMAFVYKADPVRGPEWTRLFAAKAPDIPFHIWPDTRPARHWSGC